MTIAPTLVIQIETLFVVEETDHAVGWNAALREALRIASLHRCDEAIAQKISERTTDGLAERKKAGKKLGGADAPYGYRARLRDGKLFEVAYEQRVIAMARELTAKNWGVRRIATRLNELGKRPRTRGARFSPTQVQRMLDYSANPTTVPNST